MGRDSDVARQSNLELKYTKQELLKDAFFGEFYIFNDSANDSKIICIEKLISDKEALKREIEQIKKKILNKHDYILNLLDYSVEVQSNLCSTFYLLKIFYEYPNKSLKKEINERKLQGGSTGNFKNTELTHLLYHQIIAHSYLQDNKITHGDISPGTIFLTNKGDYKVAFRLNNKLAPEKLHLEKLMKNEPVYLSPALYNALKRRNLTNIVHSAVKSDVFSFGLCMLETGLLRSIQSIYSKGDEIDQHMLNIYLDEFEMKYADNPLLFSSVRKMCEIDENDRPSFTDLKLALPDYAEICDYFYKVEHGLINEEEDVWDENSPDPNQNFQSNDYQDGYQQNYYDDYNNNNNNFNQDYGVKDNKVQGYNQQMDYNNGSDLYYGNQNNNQYVSPQSNIVQPAKPQYDSNYNAPQYNKPSNNFEYNQPNVQAPITSNNFSNYNQPPTVQTVPQTNNGQTNSNNNFFEKYAEYDFFSDVPAKEEPKTYNPPQQNYNAVPQHTYAPQTYVPQQTFNNQPTNPYVQSQPKMNTYQNVYQPQSNVNTVPQNDFFGSYTPQQPKVSYSTPNQSNYEQPSYQQSFQNKRPESQTTYGSTTIYSGDNYTQRQQYGQPQNYYRGY